jgi:cytochrome c oxidase assembly protein subunit 16
MPKINPFFKQFIPFAALVVGAYYGMMEFRKINYKYDRPGSAILFREQLKKMGATEDDYQAKTTMSMEEEYDKLMKKIDLDNWQNVRGPRPWELLPGETPKQFQDRMKRDAEETKNSSINK